MTRLAPLISWRSAITDSGLSSTTRHVALALSLYMNERGSSAHPGPARLASDTGYHVSTVKEKLAELEAGGWLCCIKRGGLRGERRVANEYEARTPPTPLPIGLGDPSPSDTRRLESGDPSPSPEQPVAVGDPNTPENSSEIPSGGSPNESEASRLVAGYVSDYQATHRGRPPSTKWRAMAGKATAAVLADGEDPDVVASCLGAIARENKQPSVLANVLADYWSREAAS